MKTVTRESLAALELLVAPVWIFDLDNEQPFWANAAALALFTAPDVASLQQRLVKDPMTPGTRRRLLGYREPFLRGETVTEEWTFYPTGCPPQLTRCVCSGVYIVEGDERHVGMLVEARVINSGLGNDERRLVEALRHCNELISIYRQDGSLVSRNPAAAEVFGTYSLQETFEREGDYERIASGWTRTRPPLREDLPMRSRAGVCWFDTEVVSVRDPVTGEESILVVQHDITRLRASLAELEQARDEAHTLRENAVAASRAKSVFLATMSHELRTPMTGVLAAAELLADSDLDSDQHEALDMVVQGGHQMVAIIDDVLHVARDDLGESSPTISLVELRPLVTATLHPLGVAAEEKGLRLNAHVDEALPIAISSDPRRLRQIITNLVANAIRYTDRGQIDVSLSYDDKLLRIEVRDTGIGIDSAESEKLFEAFHQESTERGGTGLGLHITRSLAHALEGEIGAHGARGQGSTFWVTLPLVAATDEMQPTSKKEPLAPLALNVLIVDDNALNRRAFSRMLKRWQCTVQEAGDGLEALGILSSDSAVDAVLMDVNMPRMNGVEATRELRALLGHSLKIIALTADTLREEDTLFDGLLYKPVDWQRLYAMLRPISR